MRKEQNASIGIFDSGVGGLTVVKELLKKFPRENIIYFGDTARVPYGTKSPSTIIRFSFQNVKLLLKFKVKLIIVACNTSASIALKALRKKCKIPILDVVEPGVKKAIAVTKNKRIGIIGTTATVNSRTYQKLIKKEAPRIKTYTQSCPLFVPLVEENWLNKKVTFEIARQYLAPLKISKVDTLILGCTHYPLLRGAIAKNMGSGICLISSAVPLIEEIAELARQNRISLNTNRARGNCRFLVSDEPEKFKTLGEKFLGRKIPRVEKVKF